MPTMRAFLGATGLALLSVTSLSAASDATHCGSRRATLVYPADGATKVGVLTPSGPRTLLVWSQVRNSASYDVFVTTGQRQTPAIVAHTTDDEFAIVDLPAGAASWFVVTNFDNACSSTSDAARFVVEPQCLTPTRTSANVIRTITAGEQYQVRWRPVLASTQFELQESTTADFASPQSIRVDGAQYQLAHDVAAPTPFYYRVRAVAFCSGEKGPFSTIVRTVVLPKPGDRDARHRLITQVNNRRVLKQNIVVPPLSDGSQGFFSIESDKPWLTVFPPNGALSSGGTTVQASIDVDEIDAGAHSASLSIVRTPPPAANGKLATNATAAAPIKLPVNVAVVTPVDPGTRPAPTDNTLIIPSVSHADGVNSQWQSDVRLLNPNAEPQQYTVTFTPSGSDVSSTEVHTTTIELDPGDTSALDDLVSTWYGFGALGDGQAGTLQVTPVEAAGSTTHPKAVVSSRTYNVSEAGTLGQFIPAIPYSQFAGAGAKLSLQQIAQSSAFRTNIGLVEGAGQPAGVTLKVYAANGSKVSTDIPIQLAAGEQVQLNSFLANNGITNLADGRVSVEVTSGGGKVAAYASVVDNATQDPLLVTGVDASKITANAFTVPGVADLNAGPLHWRTDLRLFNAGTIPQTAAVSFFPSTPSNQTLTPFVKAVDVAPGQIAVLDDILHALFGQSNVGGAIQVTTAAGQPLVVSGRTYDQEPSGTYGQFVPAVTPVEATGLGDNGLQILQVEQSDAFRSNIGLAEVTGHAATVEVTAFVPDTKAYPTIQVPLRPNEFIQLNSLLASLGYATAYNARIQVRVVEGTGRVTAYASVVDNRTADPTYVPAQ